MVDQGNREFKIEEIALADGKTIARLAEQAGITFKSGCITLDAKRGHLLALAVKQGRVYEIRCTKAFEALQDELAASKEASRLASDASAEAIQLSRETQSAVEALKSQIAEIRRTQQQQSLQQIQEAQRSEAAADTDAQKRVEASALWFNHEVDCNSHSQMLTDAKTQLQALGLPTAVTDTIVSVASLGNKTGQPGKTAPLVLTCT